MTAATYLVQETGGNLTGLAPVGVPLIMDGDVIDILVHPRRDRRAAERFFRKLLQDQGAEPLRLQP